MTVLTGGNTTTVDNTKKVPVCAFGFARVVEEEEEGRSALKKENSNWRVFKCVANKIAHQKKSDGEFRVSFCR